MSFFSSLFIALSVLTASGNTFTGSEYQLSHEYSGSNFFDGWDFYSGRDPTGGFVTYYSRSSAHLTGLITTSDHGPAYMGVNSVDKLPFDNRTGRGDGAGRPSIRIASKQAFTHGLFIGDFEHIPAGICGTWPAFWTLGPNWPYTGEIDILEGVNQNTNNLMSLHTNETCMIEGDATMMTGQIQNKNCAYYPDYNVGCGVADSRTTSYGVGFNQAKGGVYAMQWTSESILIWNWNRADIPADIDNKTPDPGSWGLPAAQLAVGNCSVDQHFQSHKIIFDTTFCGEYAGNPYVWKTDDDNSCEATTGLSTCDKFVANHPEAFKDAYWSVNYVRVYQLIDPEATSKSTSYIASEQQPSTNTYTAPNTIATPDFEVDSLCPTFNYSIISDGKFQYEIACDVDPPGPDILGTPYDGFKANSLADCIKGCTYMNENNGTNKCGGVSHYANINFCYFKKYIDGTPVYRKGYNEVRLIYYGYPQITDDPRSLADSTLTSVFAETIPTPQTYRPLTTTSRATLNTTSVMSTSTLGTTSFLPALGDNSTTTSTNVPPDYSESVTQSYLNTSSTRSSPTSTFTSTDPSATDAEFYIVFNVQSSTRRIAKRNVEYLAFDRRNESTLVTSEADAAVFYLDKDGSLRSGHQYVTIDKDRQPARFSLQSKQPTQPVTVNVDDRGVVSISGAEGYCLGGNGSLAITTSSIETPDDCRAVSPELIAAPVNTTMSISSSTTTRTFSSTSSIHPGSNSSNSSASVTRSTTSPSTSTSLPTVNSFIYAGCFGISVTASPASLPRVSLGLTSSSMTNEKCTAACRELNAYYAATHEEQCLCGRDASLYANLLDYPDSSCSIPCPGANREMCGGNVHFDGSAPGISTGEVMPKMRKRQNADIILVNLYNNTLLLPQPGESGIPTETDTVTSTTTSTGTVTSSATSASAHSTMSTNSGFDPATIPTDSIIYNVTGTNTVTVLSTTYVDVCHTCPGGLATQATTITVPHCGCTSSYDAKLQTNVVVPSPLVPMVTTVKQCACGHKGAQSAVTITLPHTNSIQELEAQVNQISIAKAAGTAANPGVAVFDLSKDEDTGMGISESTQTSTKLEDSVATNEAQLINLPSSAYDEPDQAELVAETSPSPVAIASSSQANPVPAPAPSPYVANIFLTSSLPTNSLVVNNFTLPLDPIQSYTPLSSSASSALKLSRSRASWIGNRYILSALGGATLIGLGALW